MSRLALLDVNVLVALFSPDHVHHELAHDWFTDHCKYGWATCPVTENGFVRVLSGPAGGGSGLRAPELIERLQRFCSSKQHVFWPDAVSLLDATLFDPRLASGHRQITDIYLLGLSRKMDGTLATFDRTIPMGAVIGATRATLSVIGATGEDK